jgi:hypothetical protein
MWHGGLGSNVNAYEPWCTADANISIDACFNWFLIVAGIKNYTISYTSFSMDKFSLIRRQVIPD